MLFDYHCHSGFSPDAHDSILELVQGGIANGMDEICITDHYDVNFVRTVAESLFPYSNREITRIQKLLKEQGSSFRLLRGIEMGLTPDAETLEAGHAVAIDYPYDLVLLSEHITGGYENWMPALYEKHPGVEAYEIYFRDLLEIVKNFDDFDVAAHLSLPDRYVEKRADEALWFDMADAVLQVLVSKGKGLELNVSTWVRHQDFKLPTERILRRYKELGGEYITTGSDSHRYEFIGKGIREGQDFLRSLGYRYITTYRQHVPTQHLL